MVIMSKVKEYYDDLSRYLCYLLRHSPEHCDLHMDGYGYVLLDELIEKINAKGEYKVTKADIYHIVQTDEKKRYKIADTFEGKMIKCNQGHSIPCVATEFHYDITPPKYLYHGTTRKAYDHIMRDGMIKEMDRQFVHLTADLDMAWKSAKRWKDEVPVVLVIDIKRCRKNGIWFGVTDNNVWGAEGCVIPTNYIANVLYKQKKEFGDFEVTIETSTIFHGGFSSRCCVIDKNGEKRLFRRESGWWGDGLLDTLDHEIKGIIQYLGYHYYLSDYDKKDIAEKMIDTYKKWEKEKETDEMGKK